jgi:hypothetical protein
MGIPQYTLRPADFAAKKIRAEVTPKSAPVVARKASESSVPAFNKPERNTRPQTPSLLDELGAQARTPRLLVLLSAPRMSGDSVANLLNNICRVLPPHQKMDANDQPTIWLPVLLFGERSALMESSVVVRAPTLHDLRGNGRAKRALWQALKPLLRATRTTE